MNLEPAMSVPPKHKQICIQISPPKGMKELFEDFKQGSDRSPKM